MKARRFAVILTEDEAEEIRAWIKGIDQEIWDPTPATKQQLAVVLRRVLGPLN